MRLALVHHQDPENIGSFSGTSFFMTRAIKEEFGEVVEYNSFESFDLFKSAFRDGIQQVLQPIGKKLTDFLNSNRVDVDYIISVSGNSCIPYYNHHTPIVFWHDTTWHTFLQGYRTPEAFQEFKVSYRNMYLWDTAVFSRADMLIYASEFVADACARDYETPRKKISVIPFGANIENSPSALFLQEALDQRLAANCIQLTFSGRDWKRKGLENAYLLTKELNERGIQTLLNVLGCTPDIPGLDESPFVVNWGYLDKSRKADTDTWIDILKRTHFLIHPALAEPFGIALCEANAYGIPVIGTPVEGLRTIIRHGVNGFMFDIQDWLGQARGAIEGIVRDFPAVYPALFHSSLKEYHERLNWRTNVLEFKRVLQSRLTGG
jgi:glycosyltransferase involved in cell wall biosynthesis